MHPPTKTLSPRDNKVTVMVNGIERGHIYWAAVDPTVGSEQGKRRPWLVVSASRIHRRMPLLIGVPLTSKLSKDAADFRNFRIRIPANQITVLNATLLSAVDQLALTEQVRALAHERLDSPPAAKVSNSALASVEAGLKFVLDMP
jgi:mRNA interferase MazF